MTIESLHKALHIYLNDEDADSPENIPVVIEKPYAIAPNSDEYWDISETYLWKGKLRMVTAERLKEQDCGCGIKHKSSCEHFGVAERLKEQG